MQNPYSEDQLIEQTAIALLENMGWHHQNCIDEFQYSNEKLTGRETKTQVVLTDRLRAALERLNPDVPSDAIDTAIETLTQSRSVMNPVEANREIYNHLKNGVMVRFTDPNTDEEKVSALQVIDWNNSENNDYFATSQFWITGDMYTKRPDLICFVNGIPLVLMEFKRIDENLISAYNDNIRDYKDTIPHLFWYNAIIIVSNGSESRIGSFTAEWEHFTIWKRIETEDEEQKTSLEALLRGTCEQEIEELLDRSIAPEGYIIDANENTYTSELLDLSQIDFEQLAEQFNTEHKRTVAERLKGAINKKLKVMVQLNRTRIDLQEKRECS